MKGTPLWSDKVWTHWELQLWNTTLTELPLCFTWHNAAVNNQRHHLEAKPGKTKYNKGQWVYHALSQTFLSSIGEMEMILPAGSSGLLADRLEQTWAQLVLSSCGLWLTRVVCSALGWTWLTDPSAPSTPSEFEFTVKQCKCILRRPSAPSASSFHFFQSLSLLSVCLSSSCMEGAGRALTNRQTDRQTEQMAWTLLGSN